MRLIAVLALLAGCTPAAPPDEASLPAGSFGGALGGDARLVNLAADSWRDPAALTGHTGQGVRAVAAVELLAGELAVEPRWAGLPATARAGMAQARLDVRAAIGVAPGTRSQAVLDSLARADAALAADDPAATRAALDAPFYTLGPEATLQRLGSLPVVLSAAVATIQVQNAFGVPEAE